jgi:hypothetical protein
MLERHKVLIDIVMEWVKLLALLVGGIFAGIQYMDRQNGERVKETLAYLNRFNTGEVLDARRRIASVWDDKLPQQTDLLEKKPFVDADYRQFMIATVKETGIAQDVALIIEYFESLEVCIRAKICDGDAAAQFLKPEALNFFRQHATHIKFIRDARRDPRFAHVLEVFAKRER